MIKLDGLGSSLRERNETDAARGKGIGFFSSLLHYGIKFSINALAMTALQYHLLALQRISAATYPPAVPACPPPSPTLSFPPISKWICMKEIKRTKRRLAVIPTSFLDCHLGGSVFFFILLLLSLLFPQSHRLTFTQQPAASTSVHDFHILHVGNLQPGCCRRDKRSRSLQAARCQIFRSARFCCSPVGFAKTKNRGVRFFTRWAFIVVQKCINWLCRRLRACLITASAIWRASR